MVSKTLLKKNMPKKANAWRTIAIGGKLSLKRFTKIMDANNYISIIIENYKGMKSLRIEELVVQFNNDQ